MFRANDSHKQQPIFSSLDWMHEKARERFKKSWAPVFYEHVFCHINEEPFTKLYSKTGRPNTPVNILLSLEYIKYMKDLNDQDLLDSLYLDYQTTYAVGGKTLGEIYISERTLYYFRERVYEYLTEHPEDENLLFGQFIELLRNFAKLTGTSLDEQRTDTTMFVSNIKKAGRLALAYDVLEKGVKAIPKEQRPESMGKVLEKDFKTEMLHKVRTVDTESRLTTLLSMSAEALKILKELPDKKESDEVRIPERFIKEQSETDKNGNLVPKKSKEISSDSLQSAYDEDATYRKKGNKGQSGYVLEVSETCSKDNKVQLITDYAVKPNIVSDKEILSGRIRKVKENTGCTDMYIDGGFHSEDVYKAAEANDVQIHLTDMCGRKPSDKISVSEFEIKEETGLIEKCPAGHMPFRSVRAKGQLVAYFETDVCLQCEHFNRCYSKQQNKNCVVRISEKAMETARKREEIATCRKENVSKRAGIEGTVSALKRTGLNNMKVRGLIKSTVVCGFLSMAQNIKRVIKFLQGGYAKVTT
jgi:hypothetical protein